MKWLITLLIVCSFMFSDTIYMDVSQFNANLSKLVKLIQDGNTTASEELLKELVNAARECDFGVSEKREKNHNYISPYLSKLPDALKYKTLQDIDAKIRDRYHQTIQQINEANQQIAIKKYFTALKILITGFQTYKSTIDLIKTDYSLKELLELPSNLSQTVEQYKQDAENIKAKFDSIKSEKEKLQYLVDFKNALWSLVQKVRGIKRFLLDHRYYLTQLDKSIGYCNDGIKWINEEVFLPMPKDGDTSADVTPYDRELSEVKNGLISKHITVKKYVDTRNSVKSSVHNICSKVGECSIGSVTQKATEKCYTRDPSILECLRDDELEENVTYYDTVLKINDGEMITPTPFDFDELKSYVNNYNNYLALKDKYLNKFQELIQLIDNTDFLMTKGEYTSRPISLDPIYVKDELTPLVNGKLPSECNSQVDDNNMSVSYVGSAHDGSGSLTMFDETPSSGPSVFDTGYVYSYSTNKIPSIWYEDMKYEDKVKKEAEEIFDIAYTGYANKPRCTYSMFYNHCYYTIALFNESKMRDMQHDINLLASDLDDYKSDLSYLSSDVLKITYKANELLSLYNQLLQYQSSLDLKDMDFYIPGTDNLIFYVYIGAKYGIYDDLHFLESYELLSFISSISDIFESKRYDITKHVNNTKDEIYRQYIDPIDSTFSFNVKLKENQNEINKTCTSLRQYSYKDKLNSLYDSISSIIWDLKNGKIKDIYNEANSMKSKYNEIINQPLNEIASNLQKIDGYFKLIKDGSIWYHIFKGDNLVFKENQNIVNNMISVYWPACNHTFSNENIINKYFNYNELKNNLPKVKAFIDRYTSDAYKPKPPAPSKFILEKAKMTPPAIYGPHKVEFTLKFKNVNHTYWGTCYFDLATAMEPSDYEFESVEGYNPIYYNSYGNEHRDHYYTTPNKEGVVKFALNIKDDNFGDVPLKSIYVHAYMTSDELHSWSFNGENVNAKMFEIKDIKNDKDLDTNGDHIADSWENRYNISDINADDDNDGLSNKEEYFYGSDPLKVDSDGDGIDDATEIKYGLDPSLSFDAQADNDNDGISNKEEILNGYDPNNADSPAKKVYENIDIKGKKFDINVYAVSDANLSNISISFDFTEGFTLLDAKSDSYTIDSDSRTIEIDNLPSGTTKVATITFENDNLQKDFTFKCSSDTIFCSNLKSNFLFAIFEYNLNKGWNLIDNPYDTNLSLSNFDNCDVVWQYDNGWKAYSKKYEQTLKEFNITQTDTLPSKNGAWVYCNEDQSIHTTNLNIQNSLFKSLNEGWNLVGIKLDIGANDIFTIYPDAKTIWSWKDGIWSYAINSDEFNSTLQDIDKNSAIWIKKE